MAFREEVIKNKEKGMKTTMAFGISRGICNFDKQMYTGFQFTSANLHLLLQVT